MPLLHVGGDHIVTELEVTPRTWLAGRDLASPRLRDAGVIVLGVERSDGTYLGIPRGDTIVRPGDVLVTLSRRSTIAQLDGRRSGPSGDAAHDDAVREHVRRADDEAAAEHRR